MTHTLNTDIDPYGNILQSAAVAYPRMTTPSGLPAMVTDLQDELHVLYTTFVYTNDVITAGSYRLRAPVRVACVRVDGRRARSGAVPA